MLAFNPHQTVEEIIKFIQLIFAHTHKQTAVIAVSGGIDSAVALTLLTQALGVTNIMPVMLPYGDQDVKDSQVLMSFNKIPAGNVSMINIQTLVEVAARLAKVGVQDKVRLGNLMARTRMMMVYDLAKKNDALVCGTENKSEKYLGYFTRFGDQASDLEPLTKFYKTQIRQLGRFLNLPQPIITKQPTAGLWVNQTDEQELGFSYEMADQVLTQLIDQKLPINKIRVEGVALAIVNKVIQRVTEMKFKQNVPYVIS